LGVVRIDAHWNSDGCCDEMDDSIPCSDCGGGDPIGACCYEDGTCDDEITSDQCSDNEGEYKGDYTNCSACVDVGPCNIPEHPCDLVGQIGVCDVGEHAGKNYLDFKLVEIETVTNCCSPPQWSSMQCQQWDLSEPCREIVECPEDPENPLDAQWIRYTYEWVYVAPGTPPNPCCACHRGMETGVEDEICNCCTGDPPCGGISLPDCCHANTEPCTCDANPPARICQMVMACSKIGCCWMDQAGKGNWYLLGSNWTCSKCEEEVRTWATDEGRGRWKESDTGCDNNPCNLLDPNCYYWAPVSHACGDPAPNLGACCWGPGEDNCEDGIWNYDCTNGGGIWMGSSMPCFWLGTDCDDCEKSGQDCPCPCPPDGYGGGVAGAATTPAENNNEFQYISDIDSRVWVVKEPLNPGGGRGVARTHAYAASGCFHTNGLPVKCTTGYIDRLACDDDDCGCGGCVQTVCSNCGGYNQWGVDPYNCQDCCLCSQWEGCNCTNCTCDEDCI